VFIQVKAIVLDGPDSWAQLMQREGTIAKFCPIDFSDAEHVFENCRKVRGKPDGCWALGLPVACLLSLQLRLLSVLTFAR
jgi:hypothetical protein